MSLEPMLQGVPSVAYAPQGTITVSLASVQNNLQGSPEIEKKITYRVRNIEHKDNISSRIIFTLIKIRPPFVLFAFVGLVIVLFALDGPKCCITIGTRLAVADLISSPFTDAKLPTCCGYWMVTFSLHE